MKIICPFCKKKYDVKDDCRLNKKSHKKATIVCECGKSFNTSQEKRLWFWTKYVSKKRET